MGESIARLYNNEMEKLLAAMFVALLTVGCGGDGKSGSNGSESNQSSVEMIDLDDNETRNRIIAEAIDNDDIPSDYTGWAKDGMWSNGQIQRLIQFKDGKLDGHLISWYEDGTESHRYTYKDGKIPRRGECKQVHDPLRQTMRIQWLQHVSFEGLGCMAEWFLSIRETQVQQCLVKIMTFNSFPSKNQTRKQT